MPDVIVIVVTPVGAGLPSLQAASPWMETTTNQIEAARMPRHMPSRAGSRQRVVGHDVAIRLPVHIAPRGQR
jgi:hypothetical protein